MSTHRRTVMVHDLDLILHMRHRMKTCSGPPRRLRPGRVPEWPRNRGRSTMPWSNSVRYLPFRLRPMCPHGPCIGGKIVLIQSDQRRSPTCCTVGCIGSIRRGRYSKQVEHEVIETPASSPLRGGDPDSRFIVKLVAPLWSTQHDGLEVTEPIQRVLSTIITGKVILWILILESPEPLWSHRLALDVETVVEPFRVERIVGVGTIWTAAMGRGSRKRQGAIPIAPMDRRIKTAKEFGMRGVFHRTDLYDYQRFAELHRSNLLIPGHPARGCSGVYPLIAPACSHGSLYPGAETGCAAIRSRA